MMSHRISLRTPPSSRSFLAVLVALTTVASFPAAVQAEAGPTEGRDPAVRYDVEVTLAVGSGGPAESSGAAADALHRESVARHREYLRGLTASYRMNAYVDYRIAGAITRFVTGESATEDGASEDGATEDGATEEGEGRDGAGPSAPPPAGTWREVVERAWVMRSDLPRAGNDSEQTQRLLVRAFTQRYLNGYADLMWARWIERVNRLEPVHREDWYGAAAETGRPDLFFWTYLLRGSVAPIADFTEDYGPFTLSDEAVVDEIVYVQHANRAANEAILDELLHAMEGFPRRGGPAAGVGRSGGSNGAAPEAPLTRKSALLIAYAEKSPYPREFLRGAVAAQRGAGRWDGAFEKLLRWRF